jgi:hypothetical protein
VFYFTVISNISKIREYIRISMCTTGIHKTVGKAENCCVTDTLTPAAICRQYQHHPVIKFVTGVIDTSGAHSAANILTNCRHGATEIFRSTAEYDRKNPEVKNLVTL